MAGEETIIKNATGRREIAAGLFLGGAYVSLDAMSTLNSSPWTAESFGGDPEKEKSLREYVAHALVLSSACGAISGVVAGGRMFWAPVSGAALINVYLFWLYRRAIQRAQRRGSTSWGEGATANPHEGRRHRVRGNA